MGKEFEEGYLETTTAVFPDLDERDDIKGFLLQDGDARAFFLKVATAKKSLNNPEKQSQKETSEEDVKKIAKDAFLEMGFPEDEIGLLLDQPKEVLEMSLKETLGIDIGNAAPTEAEKKTEETLSSLKSSDDVFRLYINTKNKANAFWTDLLKTNNEELYNTAQSPNDLELIGGKICTIPDPISNFNIWSKNDSFDNEVGNTVTTVMQNTPQATHLASLINIEENAKTYACELYGSELDENFSKKSPEEKSTIIDLIEQHPRETLALAMLKTNDVPVRIHNLEDFKDKLNDEKVKDLASHIHPIALKESLEYIVPKHISKEGLNYSKNLHPEASNNFTNSPDPRGL